MAMSDRIEAFIVELLKDGEMIIENLAPSCEVFFFDSYFTFTILRRLFCPWIFMNRPMQPNKP